MEKYDHLLKGLGVTRIVALTPVRIFLGRPDSHGLEYNLKPNEEISIWTERSADQKLDAICRATNPTGDRPEEYIDLSRVEWFCSRGGKLEVFSDDGEECSFFELEA